MSSHWWWHPKCLTSTPSSHNTNELLYGFCGDYPLSLTMSANDRAGTSLKWFLPLQSAAYMRGGGQMMGVRLHHPLAGWLFIYFSFRFTPLVLKRHSEQERSPHSRSHHKVDWTCRCRCLGLSFKTGASPRLHFLLHRRRRQEQTNTLLGNPVFFPFPNLQKKRVSKRPSSSAMVIHLSHLKCMRPNKRIKTGVRAKGAAVKVKVIHAAKAFPLDATAGVHAKLWALIKSDNAAWAVCITNVWHQPGRCVLPALKGSQG